MINTFSLKVVGKEDEITKFRDYLKENRVEVNIGIRSSSNDSEVIFHLIVKSRLDHFLKILHDWFNLYHDVLIISGDKDYVDMSEMDEIVFSHNDSNDIIMSKLKDLVDRQKHYEANTKRSLRSWKSKGRF